MLSTHILDEAEKVCDRAVIISKGRIVVDSTPQALITDAPSHNVIRLSLDEAAPDLVDRLGAEPWCHEVRELADGTYEVVPEDSANHLRDVLPLLEGTRLRDIHVQEGRFDELFRNLTQGVCT